MERMSVICIKEINVDYINISIGEIHEVAVQNYNEIIKGLYYSIKYRLFFDVKNFLTLAEWRDKQIDEILS